MFIELEREEIEFDAPDTNMILTTMITQLALIEVLKQRQPKDSYLWEIYEEIEVNPKLDFTLRNGALEF